MTRSSHQIIAGRTFFSFLIIAAQACSAASPTTPPTTPAQPPPQLSQNSDPAPAPPPSPPDLTAHHQYSFAMIEQALTLASTEAIGTQRPLQSPLTYQEILDETRQVPSSLSLGTVRSGALSKPARLEPATEFYEILITHRPRNTNFGTAQLVQAIEDAAKAVMTELGGAPLQVGNLSFNRGGRIPWSNSHQAGRDADLAIFALTATGESVPTPGLIPFGDDGKALNHDLYFDTPRNWALVRALLLNPDINLQWIFISEALKDRLLTHAHEIGEAPELIERAAHILHQPTDALPHNDHFHLRIGCPLFDRLEGCIDWGPRWPWYDWHDAPLLARTAELHRALDDENPAIRRQALAMLLKIRSPWAPEVALLRGLADPDHQVRHQALMILEEMAPQTTAGILALQTHLESGELASQERAILYDGLRRIQKPLAATLAFKRFQDHSLTDEERSMALRALDHQMLPELIPQILNALDNSPSPEHRRLLANLLYRIAAREDGLDWAQEPLTQKHEQALQNWQQWWTEHTPERELLLRAFLEQRGIQDWMDLERVDEIILLLRSSADFERYSANIILSQWTGRWAPRDWESPDAAHRSWSRWWNRNRERMLQGRPRAWE